MNKNVFDPNKETLEPITGDFDSEGKSIRSTIEDHKSTGHSTIQFNKMTLGHPKIRYKDYLIEADVYGAGNNISVHIICPRCRHSLSIPSEKKDIEYNKETNSLSISPFECTWELDDERREFGLSLCRWRVGISNNIATDA